MGVKRPVWHHSGRLTPEMGTRLVFNARNGQEAHVKRQKWAVAWRLTPGLAEMGVFARHLVQG